MRPKLESKLVEIDELLLEMGTRTEEQLANAIKALMTHDIPLAKKVVERDKEIDELEITIEKKCLDTIALQNPLASDLRKLSSVLKIITDLERIGDHCVNMAEIVVEMGIEPHFKPLIDIPKMAAIVQEMVNASLDSYSRKNPALAILTAQRDDEVDAMYLKIYKELLEIIHEDKSHMDQIVSLLFIGRFLERIADHVTNICERSVFIATGERVNF